MEVKEGRRRSSEKAGRMGFVHKGQDWRHGIAVKRLMREAKELYEPTEQYYAQPLEDNLFEWHFTVQGAADTDFECGRYHGRIILPPEYPMKPPSIMLLTPNGRFEIGKKICLSMSAHHPETWQPSWSIRTVLLAIIGFMPSKGGGAIGALDYTPEERKTLARKSMTWTCNVCGSCNSDSLKEAEPGSQKTMNGEAEELASQINFKGENEKKLEETTDIPDGTIADSTWTPDNGSLNNRNGEGLNTIGKSTSEELSAETDDVTSRADVVTANKNTDTPIRRRGSKRPSVKHGSPSVSVTTSEPTARERSSCFSTILIVILATCFVLLLLRRIFKE